LSGYDGSAADIFDFHHSMLADETRTAAFLRAILATVKSGDVVVDIGSGTGVLSLFAAMAGASRVYAIEREPIIEVARDIASGNGLSETIRFIDGSSLDVEIPELADVLITETIGNSGFDEGISAWVADAKERFLKPNAVIVPQQVDAVASLVSVPRDYASIERWSQPLLTLDFAPLRRMALNNILWTDLSPAAIVTPPAVVFGLDSSSEPEPLSGSVRVVAIKNAVVHGIGLWFRSTLSAGISITNAPPKAVPSWDQGFLPLEEPIGVHAGESVCFEVSASASGADWIWQVGSGKTHSTRDGRLPARKITERLD
jgi:protein arginine N-methyltransferase 1